MKKQKTSKINLSLWLVIGVIGTLAVGTIAFAGSFSIVIENCNDCFGGSGEQASFGASGTRFPNGISADSTSPSSGEVRGTTLTTTGAATVGGAATLSSNLTVAGTLGVATTAPATNFDVEGLIRIYPDGTATSTCDSSTEGGLMYATGTADLYFCNGTAWTEI